MKVIVRALVRWSWLLVLCLLVGWFGGRALAKALPPTYQATAIVQLNAQLGSTRVIQPVTVYAALVTSDSILNPVLKQYPVLDRQTLVLKQLVVSSDSDAQTISIQVTLPDAKVAVGVANMLAQLLITQQNAYIKSQYVKQLRITNDTIDSEQKTIDHLNQQIVRLASTSVPPDQFAAAMQQLNSELSQQQDLQSQAISSKQELLAEQALYSVPLSIVQLATVPTRPSSLNGLLPLSPVPVLSAVMLMLGLVAISFLERGAGRINGTYAMQQKTGLLILGSLRWTRPPPERVPVAVLCEAKTPYAEDCRVMMVDMLFQAEAAHARILAITSLREHAGSSVIASQLAALLALSKRHVLLVDGNLYSPSQHKRMKISNKVGLARMLEEARMVKVGIDGASDPALAEIVEKLPVESSNDAYLTRMLEEARMVKVGTDGIPGSADGEIAGQLPMESCIMSTGIQNLHVLPAGSPKINPSILLSMPEMGQILKWAAERNDFVVIDCPPLTYSEAHVLGSLSDQTFLVVDATGDRVKQVVNTKEKLLNSAVKVSGLIINKLGRWV